MYGIWAVNGAEVKAAPHDPLIYYELSTLNPQQTLQTRSSILVATVVGAL